MGKGLLAARSLLCFYSRSSSCRSSVRQTEQTKSTMDSKKLLFFIIVSIAGTGVRCHQCFVCKPTHLTAADAHELRKTFKGLAVRNCNEYHKSARTDFIHECPKESSGCLAKYDGNSVMRTCTQVPINECKEMNGVTYCYCKGQLCNSPEQTLSGTDQVQGATLDDTISSSSSLEVDHGSGWGENDDDEDNDYSDASQREFLLKKEEEEYKRIAAEVQIQAERNVDIGFDVKKEDPPPPAAAAAAGNLMRWWPLYVAAAAACYLTCFL